MRDYALHPARSFEAVGDHSLIGRFVRNWLARRAVSQLGHFDDHLLKDIGVTRGDIGWASKLPLTENPAAALDDRVNQRRRTFE